MSWSLLVDPNCVTPVQLHRIATFVDSLYANSGLDLDPEEILPSDTRAKEEQLMRTIDSHHTVRIESVARIAGEKASDLGQLGSGQMELRMCTHYIRMPSSKCPECLAKLRYQLL